MITLQDVFLKNDRISYLGKIWKIYHVGPHHLILKRPNKLDLFYSKYGITAKGDVTMRVDYQYITPLDFSSVRFDRFQDYISTQEICKL